MTRDTLVDKEYFDRWISFVQSRNIDHDLKQIELLENEEGRAQCGDDLVRNSIQIGIMMYGRGDSIADLAGSVDQMIAMLKIRKSTLLGLNLPPSVRSMYERLDLGKLYDAFAMLSFVCAIRPTSDLTRQVISLIGHSGEDAVFDQIAEALGSTPEKRAERVKFPKIHEGLAAVIAADHSARPALLHKFVDRWYKNMKPVYWHGNHEEGEGSYFGYWCFEAALAAMVFNIDDSALKGHPNYPSDLVENYRLKSS